MKFYFALVILFTCYPHFIQAQKGFKLQGTIENYTSGEIYLILENNPRDTLAKAPVVKGKFKLTGKIATPQIAYFRIKNAINGPSLFLEPTSFEVHLQTIASHAPGPQGKLVAVQELNDELHSHIQGGKDQETANRFWQLIGPNRLAYDTLRMQYAQAAKNNDSATLQRLAAKDQTIRREMLEKARHLIAANPDSYVTAYIIQEYLIDLYEDEADAKELYELLSPQVQASGYGEQLARTIGITQKFLPKHTVLPSFTLSTPAQQSLSLADIQGQVKVLDFWASYCTPCLENMPQLLKLYNTYKERGLEVITIALDTDPKTAEKLQKKLKASWISLGQFQPTDTDIKNLFYIRTLPYQIILDKDNKIIAKGIFTPRQIEEYIEKILK